MVRDKTGLTGVRIVQSGPPHTGTTPLVNLIYGLVAPDAPVAYGGACVERSLVTKTHTTDIDKLMNRFTDYDLYFVMSERVDEKVQSKINQSYKEYENVLVIDYSEILETSEWSVDDIAKSLFAKLFKFLPKEVIPNPADGPARMAARLKSMNARYEEIKDRPFSYYDPFYHLHGSHRNRPL